MGINNNAGAGRGNPPQRNHNAGRGNNQIQVQRTRRNRISNDREINSVMRQLQGVSRENLETILETHLIPIVQDTTPIINPQLLGILNNNRLRPLVRLQRILENANDALRTNLLETLNLIIDGGEIFEPPIR